MLKKIIKLISLFVPFSGLIVASCTNHNDQISQDFQNKDYQNDIKWKEFINRDYVLDLLNTIYNHDQTQIQEYIKTQEELLLDPDYKNILSNALLFANNLTRSFGSNAYNKEETPYPLKNSDKVLDQLKTKNWLWYLYNIDSFTYINYPSVADLFTTTNEDNILNSLQNNLATSGFMSLKSNKVIDYTKQIIDDPDSFKTTTFFLVLDSGFILKIFLTPDWDNPSIIKTEISNYVYSFPKIAFKDDILDHFNIKKFVLSTEAFGSVPQDRSQQILFKEQYGGKELRFTLVDVQ
ncbi:aromatic motif membrane protein [Mycoplasmopsis sturni]|uniref:aromatic motif membrane protein n=1 Tax=Mycoplasmopsis sturni TaxID=39047 RepID=UPI00055B3C07|nr:aromatic motif membrane protein [Mycoplasmopsis sturni]